MALALDGAAVGSVVSSGTTMSVTLTTTGSNDAVFVVVVTNGAVTITNIHDASGVIADGAWTIRANLGSGNNFFEAWAIASTPLSAAVITVTVGTSVSFGEAAAFGVSGVDTPTPFDPHAGLPVTMSAGIPSDPISISTTNANDFIIGAWRFSSTPTPSPGSGWTTVVVGDHLLIEYKIVSSVQTNLSATVGTGVGDSNAGFADAVTTTAVVGGGGYPTTIVIG